jgi:hypothetical protein
MKKLNVEGWIKPRWKHNAKMKVECAIQNEHIDDLATNQPFTPLSKQEWMQALNVEEIELSFKVDIRDVPWWMSIKNACRLEMPITTKLSKEECISPSPRTRTIPSTSLWNPPLLPTSWIKQCCNQATRTYATRSQLPWLPSIFMKPLRSSSQISIASTCHWRWSASPSWGLHNPWVSKSDMRLYERQWKACSFSLTAKITALNEQH